MVTPRKPDGANAPPSRQGLAATSETPKAHPIPTSLQGLATVSEAPKARPIPAWGYSTPTSALARRGGVAPRTPSSDPKRAEGPTHSDPHNLLEELAATAAAIAGMQPTMLDRRNLKQTLKRRMETTHLHHPEAYLDLFRRELK